LEAGANPVLVAFRLGYVSTRMVEQHYSGRLDRTRRSARRWVRGTLRHGCGMLRARTRRAFAPHPSWPAVLRSGPRFEPAPWQGNSRGPVSPCRVL